MDLGDLKQRAVQARQEAEEQERARAAAQEQERTAKLQAEEIQRKGRVETDAQADIKRGGFQHGRQQEQVAGAIEQLKRSQQSLEAFKQRLEGFVTQATEHQGEKAAGKKKLEDIYKKIEGILKDPDVQKELVNLGKNIQTAEQLVADADFATDAGVIDALKIQETLAEVERQLAALDVDERQLHDEIQSHLGGKGASAELPTARMETRQLLETHMRQVEEDLQMLELHTPEGAKKAEGELAKLMPARESGWAIENKEKLVDRALQYNPVYSNDKILAYRDVVGDEKFLEIIKAAYGKQLDVDVAAFKKFTGLDTWERDFQTAGNYPEQVKEAERTIKNLRERKAELEKQLEQFFQSEQGRPILIEIVKRIQEKSFKQSSRGNFGGSLSDEQKKELEGRLEAIKAEVESSPQYYAEIHSRNFVRQLDVVMDDFAFDKSYGYREGTASTSVVEDLSARVWTGNNNHWQNNYDELPDMAQISEALRQVETFYDRLAESLQDPEAMDMLVRFGAAAEDYVHERVTDSRHGLRSALENSYLNTYWYHSLGGKEAYEKLDGLRKMLPQFDGRKIGNIKFENENFAKKPQRDRESQRDAMDRHLKEVNGFIDKLRTVVAQKAEYDVAGAEIYAFEHSPKIQEVTAHEDITKQQALIKELLPEVISLQQTVDAKRKVSMSEHQGYRRDHKIIYFHNTEKQTLDTRHVELNGQITQKEQELSRLQAQGRPGLLSGKRGTWDSAVAKLNLEIPQLKGEAEKVKNEKQALQSVENGLVKLGQLVSRIAEELPEAYAALHLDQAETTGDIYEKLTRLAQEVGDKQTSGDQREFTRDYQALQDHAKKLKAGIEQAAAQIGKRSIYL